MSQWDRRLLAFETALKGFDIGYIHPPYYFDAKAVHDILFCLSNSQHEVEDNDGAYYNALKEIIENDKEIHVRSSDMLCCLALSTIGGKIKIPKDDDSDKDSFTKIALTEVTMFV